MKTCLNCQKENNDDLKFCGYCGASLDAASLPAENLVKPKKKFRWWIIPLILILVGGIAFGVYYFVTQSAIAANPCTQEKFNAAMVKIEDVYTRFSDTASLAGSTSRIALSGPVGNMQSIYREAQKLDLPTCLAQAKDHMENVMFWTLEGYDRFMLQKEESLVKSAFEEADRYMLNFVKELDRLRACVPDCK